MLTLYIDFKSLPSYLALKPTLALANRYGASVDWRPFLTQARDVPEESRDAVLSQRHHKVRLASLDATDRKYAALQGIELSDSPNACSADLALAALALVEGDKAPLIHAAFKAYWQFHADLDDYEIVSGLLSGAGFSAGFSVSSANTALALAQRSAEAAGVVDAPCFVVASQLFLGRQHLPWVEEHLASEMR